MNSLNCWEDTDFEFDKVWARFTGLRSLIDMTPDAGISQHLIRRRCRYIRCAAKRELASMIQEEGVA